jgi:hypothetical protein
MAILIEFPGTVTGGKGKTEKRCHERNPIGSKICRQCGRSLKRWGGLVYWIEWRDHCQRKRKRIGPSKESAELSLGEIRRALVEERYTERDKGARMSLGGLVRWYLGLLEVEAKIADSWAGK